MGIRRTAVTLLDGGFGFHLSMTEISELRRFLFPARYHIVAVVWFLRLRFIHRWGSENKKLRDRLITKNSR